MQSIIFCNTNLLCSFVIQVFSLEDDNAFDIKVSKEFNRSNLNYLNVSQQVLFQIQTT